MCGWLECTMLDQIDPLNMCGQFVCNVPSIICSTNRLHQNLKGKFTQFTQTHVLMLLLGQLT